MNDYYDREQIHCTGCGHTWVLMSDKEITDELHELWVIKVNWQHIQITTEGGK